jgi:hypothetical protein
MTTSISSTEPDSLALKETAELDLPRAAAARIIPHTIYSRFLFLILCLAIVLSALAYGTVHYWALALFGLGGVVIVLLWMADGWRLGTLRVSKSVLQLPLLGMVILGLVQLLPLRNADNAAVLTTPAVRTLSLDPYSTRLVLVQVAALLIFFAAALVFVDTPRRLRIIVRTIALFGFFLAIFGLTQSFTSPTRVYWARELAQSTAFGPFINRHHFAAYMELTLAIPLGLLFSGALVGCFAVLVHSFFDFTLHTTSNALLFLVLAALATLNGRVEHAPPRRRRRRRHHGPSSVQSTDSANSADAKSPQSA